jgi:16S rRNA (uracil1498-N3)-methyltransferase
MSTRRLCVDHVLTTGHSLRIDGDRAHYIGRVLRCRPGDEITLFNGDGCEYPSRIERMDKHAVVLTIGTAAEPRVESPLGLRLIQGIARGERMDTIVQKATELGVQRLSPVRSEFSVVRLDGERAVNRLRHWQRIGQSACEQCGRTVPPQLDAPRALPEALAEAAGRKSTRLMLHPGSPLSIATMLPIAAIPEGDGLEFLIGPEGGLSSAERQQAAAAGFVAVSLGPRTLRTETAALAALTLAQALWGDLAG